MKKYRPKMIGANIAEGMIRGGMSIRYGKDGRAHGRPKSRHPNSQAVRDAAMAALAKLNYDVLPTAFERTVDFRSAATRAKEGS